jgi:predicted glycoside hydrolase/deacetylase ChbG (UPF0249 family)
MILIISADDLGTSNAINEEAFELMKAGLITSGTLIANGPAIEHAAAGITSFPECSFGVHLNLTVFRPLRPSGGLQPILDACGQLSPKLFKTPMTDDLRDAILEELEAQIQHVQSLGIPISHLDSHQHVHTLPKMFPTLKAVQRRFGIRKVRPTINLLSPHQRLSPLRSFKKQLFRVALRNVYTTASPDGLGDFRDFHAALVTGQVPTFRHLELMTHPGTGFPLYRREVDLLTSDWRRLLPTGVKFGSYRSIG